MRVTIFKGWWTATKRFLNYLLIGGILLWCYQDFNNDGITSVNDHRPVATATNNNNAANSSSDKYTHSGHYTVDGSFKEDGKSAPKPTTPPANTINPTSGYKFAKPQADCYMVTKNPKLIQAYKMAINAWNQTSAFHFNLTNNPNAPIKLGERNMDNTQQDDGFTTKRELGVTNTSYYAEQHLIAKDDVFLDNSQQLLAKSPEYISWVAEHELGHAIGLDHTAQNANSVMTPANPSHGITQSDILTVKQLYQERS